MAQRRQEIRTDLIDGTKSLKSKRKNGNCTKFQQIFLLSSWPLLQLLRLRKTMSRVEIWEYDYMTLQLCRWLWRPRWHHVRPSTVWVWDHPGVYHPLWEGLVKLWILMDENPALESERQIMSLTKWWRCDRPAWLRLHESACKTASHECQLMHRHCTGRVDIAPHPIGGQQQLSEPHYSTSDRMKILEPHEAQTEQNHIKSNV
jgi:hypothetical protein